MIYHNGSGHAQFKIASWRHSLNHAVVGFADSLVRHWLAIFTSVLGAVLGLAILAPILAYFGVQPLAGSIFAAFHVSCDQIPAHSLYIGGHQVCLCSRCMALYGSIFSFSIFYRFNRHLKALPWQIIVLLLLPMALDGGTQLFGWRESNLLLRLLTGSLFGLGIAWFAFPYVQEAANESQPTRTVIAQ